MRRGELDFNKLNLPNYNKEKFENWIEQGEWKKSLKEVEYLKSLPEIFNTFGVGLVFTPYLEKTVYGAVRWFNGNPLIQISDKGKSLPVCWHTLFHEIGHVLLHENDTVFEGEIDENKSNASKKEREANLYAYTKLFNGDDLRKYIFSQKTKQTSLHADFLLQSAKQFNVSEMFVAYWMIRAQLINRTINKYIPQVVF
jgi:Zn-dependent peptidase ImmA (M78 family)